MIPENYRTIINKLVEKTQRKQALWKKTSREDEYKISLGRGAVTTDKWFDPDRRKNYLDFRIWNEDGSIIDSIEAASSELDDYMILNELHVAAKRAYYKVDETINDIRKLLDSDDIIGRTVEDDLPF